MRRISPIKKMIIKKIKKQQAKQGLAIFDAYFFLTNSRLFSSLIKF